jgi:hypothetical protein
MPCFFFIGVFHVFSARQLKLSIEELSTPIVPTADLIALQHEISTEGRDIDDGFEAMEIAFEQLDGIYTVQNMLGNNLATNKALSPHTAQITRIAVDRIHDKLGLRPSKTVYALEHYSNDITQVRVAMEGVVDVAITVWNAIKAFSKSYGNSSLLSLIRS